MYDENAKSIFFPLFLKSQSGEGPIYFSRDDNSTTFLDNKLQSKEFQLQYNKLFNSMNPFLSINRNNSNRDVSNCSSSNNNNYNISSNSNNNNNSNSNEVRLKQAEDILQSIDNQTVLTNDQYIKLSECLIDIMQLTNTPPLNDNTDYAKGLLYQSQLIDKIIDCLKLKIAEA